MAKQIIDLGTANNPATGDTIRVGGQKVNENFTEVYDDGAAKQAEIDLNTAKVGITPQQAADITANNAKVSNIAHPLVEESVPLGAVFTDTVYDDTAIQAAVALNTAKVGITAQQSADITANNAKVSYTDAAAVAANTVKISLDTNSVTEAKLSPQYKSVSVISALNVDWSTSQVYTKTLTGNTTLTFSNLYVGVKDLEITGNFTLGLPAGFTVINGTYDGTQSNLIEVICTNSTTPTGWVTISQAS